MSKRIYVRSHYRRSPSRQHSAGNIFAVFAWLYHLIANHPKTSFIIAACVVSASLFNASNFVGMLAFGATIYLAWRLYHQKQPTGYIQSARYTELLGIRTIGDFYAMSPQQFEEFTCKLFQLQGYTAHVVGQTGDQGIDIELRAVGQSGQQLRYVAQCKRYSGTVGQPIVREFYGSFVGQAEAGYLITTGSFTQPALDFAQGRPLHLIDGTNLMRWTNSIAQRLQSPGS
jgi:HJR/Mrr/RecB family endonuclease